MVLAIDDVVARQGVHDLAVRRDAHNAGAFQDTVHVVLANRDVSIRYRHDAPVILAGKVRPSDSDVRREDTRSTRALGLLDGRAHRLRRIAQVLDHATIKPVRGSDPDAKDAQRLFGQHLPHDRADLGCSDIYRREDSALHGRASFPSLAHLVRRARSLRLSPVFI